MIRTYVALLLSKTVYSPMQRYVCNLQQAALSCNFLARDAMCTMCSFLQMHLSGKSVCVRVCARAYVPKAPHSQDINIYKVVLSQNSYCETGGQL